jgi:hypothetical protein
MRFLSTEEPLKVNVGLDEVISLTSKNIYNSIQHTYLLYLIVKLPHFSIKYWYTPSLNNEVYSRLRWGVIIPTSICTETNI